MEKKDNVMLERIEFEIPEDYICVEIEDDEAKFTHKSNEYNYEKNGDWIWKMMPYLKNDTKVVECQSCKDYDINLQKIF